MGWVLLPQTWLSGLCCYSDAETVPPRTSVGHTHLFILTPPVQGVPARLINLAHLLLLCFPIQGDRTISHLKEGCLISGFRPVSYVLLFSVSLSPHLSTLTQNHATHTSEAFFLYRDLLGKWNCASRVRGALWGRADHQKQL